MTFDCEWCRKSTPEQSSPLVQLSEGDDCSGVVSSGFLGNMAALECSKFALSAFTVTEANINVE